MLYKSNFEKRVFKSEKSNFIFILTQTLKYKVCASELIGDNIHNQQVSLHICTFVFDFLDNF